MSCDNRVKTSLTKKVSLETFLTSENEILFSQPKPWQFIIQKEDFARISINISQLQFAKKIFLQSGHGRKLYFNFARTKWDPMRQKVPEHFKKLPQSNLENLRPTFTMPAVGVTTMPAVGVTGISAICAPPRSALTTTTSRRCQTIRLRDELIQLFLHRGLQQ